MISRHETAAKHDAAEMTGEPHTRCSGFHCSSLTKQHRVRSGPHDGGPLALLADGNLGEIRSEGLGGRSATELQSGVHVEAVVDTGVETRQTRLLS